LGGGKGRIEGTECEVDVTWSRRFGDDLQDEEAVAGQRDDPSR
jgi:hypothetical protein